tara:strand:- start:23 stop:625 length:603 start_codon:yes stop_codon:yes gene_type:complete
MSKNLIKTINYNFFHWGPFLYKTSLNQKEIEQIKSLCKKNKKKDHRKHLAGLIKQEYTLSNKKLFPLISSYLQSYCKASFEHYNIITGKKITLKRAWVNYMTKFESNPLHTHSNDLSFVIYLSVPEKLKKESEDTISSGTKPGEILFVNKLEEDNLSINRITFFPEVGDFFIFPATLNHLVHSFQCEGERVSISGNIKIK